MKYNPSNCKCNANIGTDDDILCNCFGVTITEVEEAIKNGADTVEKVGEVTSAGTGCGCCQLGIQKLIDKANK